MEKLQPLLSACRCENIKATWTENFIYQVQ